MYATRTAGVSGTGRDEEDEMKTTKWSNSKVRQGCAYCAEYRREETQMHQSLVEVRAENRERAGSARSVTSVQLEVILLRFNIKSTIIRFSLTFFAALQSLTY